MYVNIRHFIERAFSEVPKTAKADEIKESLIADLTEKYDDLISRGKSTEEAYSEVIAGVGDLTELTQSLIKEAQEHYVETERDRKRAAALVICAVSLYILSPLLFALGEHYGSELIAMTLFFITIAIATGILIYYNMTKPQWKREREKDPDEIENWASPKDLRVYNLLNSALWVLAVVIFLALGFTTGLWHIIWVIFPGAAICTIILKAVFASHSRD